MNEEMRIHLAPIDRDNWVEACKLSLAREQWAFVRANHYALASLRFNPGHHPAAIYDNDTMVGFLLYEIDTPAFRLHDLMVDQNYQRKGIGRRALELLLDAVRAQTDCGEVRLGYVSDNEVARRMYNGMGFVEIEEADNGMATAVLTLLATEQGNEEHRLGRGSELKFE
jgi:diamine N-acetyltransferase